MEMMPLISVVMPSYNAEKYIHKAIYSVLNQSYTNFELIVVDDCSIDNTLNILRELSKKHLNIKVFSNEKNLGVSKTRNKGILEAKGEYIALIDSDDIWTDEKLAKQVELLSNYEAQIAYCSYGFINEKDQQIKKPFIVPAKTNFNKMLTKSVISCSTALIKSDLLKENLFNPNYYHEDYVLWMQLLKNGAIAVGDSSVLAYYRQVTGSRSSNKRNAALHRWKVYREVFNFSFFKSFFVFVKYTICAIVKYYF